ncbi:MAG: MFS transporter [Actinomycetes bacterium]
MAISAGAGVSTLYYAQPLLPRLAEGFGVGTGSISLSITATQVGYVIGLLLLLPLGDRFPRRRLVPLVSLASALFLGLSALASNFRLFLLAALFIGITAVSGQLLVPFAADLAQEQDRGRVSAKVMSGILAGIVLARLVSGTIAALLSWRWVYLIAALLMSASAVLLYRVLPAEVPQSAALHKRSLLAPWQLLRAHRLLRHRALLGALCFGIFTSTWTSLSFLLAASPYHYGPALIGLFSLAGLAGVAAANLAGHHADRGRAYRSALIAALGITLASFILLLASTQLLVLVVAIVILDMGVQAMAISNQAIYYRLDANARSSINAAYMASSFIGGAIASVLSGQAVAAHGFTGGMVITSCLALCASALALLNFGRPSQSSNLSAI